MVVQSTDTHSCSGRTLKSIYGCLELLRDDELLSVLGFVQPPGAIAAWKKYVQPHAGRDGIDAWLWSECMFMYVTARASYQPEDELTVDCPSSRAPAVGVLLVSVGTFFLVRFAPLLKGEL